MLTRYLHDDPDLPLAWSPWFAHEYITYYSIGVIDPLISLPPVSVRRNPRWGEKVWPTGPRHIDIYKESYQEHRQLDPMGAFDARKRNGDFAPDVPLGKSVEPWKVLVLYSTEPDLYPDDDLMLHKNQRITGGSHGWRHMHFKLLGTTYGIAPQAFRVHRDLANLSFENGNDYWGWRYLSRSSHYLADLGHPFHVKALPGSFLIRHYFSRHDLIRTASILHQSYEVYVERRFREGYEPFRQALQKGAKEGERGELISDTRLRDYSERARKKHTPIFNFLFDQFGRELLDIFSRQDQSNQLDAAGQSGKCLADATRLIFDASNLSKLDVLDKLTVEILENVGRMTGGLFGRFAADRK